MADHSEKNWIYVDEDGNEVDPSLHEETSPEEEGWIYVDEDGNEVDSSLYEEASPEEEKWIYVDEDGNEVDPSLYEEEEPSVDQWIYVDEDGNEVDPVTDSDGSDESPSGGLWIYVDEDGNQWIYTDDEGSEVDPSKLDALDENPTEEEWVWVDEDGNEIDPDSFDENSTVETEEWIYVDEEGNEVAYDEITHLSREREPVEDDEKNWIYVDEHGNEVDWEEAEAEESAEEPEEEAESPSLAKRKVALQRTDLSGLKGGTKKGPALNLGRPGSSPAKKRTSQGLTATQLIQPITRKPSLAPRVAARPAVSRRPAPSTRRRPPVTRVQQGPSLWPIFWVFVVGLMAAGGYYLYRDKQAQERNKAKYARIPDLPFGESPKPTRNTPERVKEKVADADPGDTKEKEEPVSGKKEPSPVIPASPTPPASGPGEAVSKPETSSPKSRAAPIQEMQVEDISTIPRRGLIAHYNALKQTGDSVFSRRSREKGTVGTWENTAGEYENQNALVPEDLDGENAPFVAVVSGTGPDGKEFDTKVVEFSPEMSLSSEENPFASRTAKGATLALLVRPNSNGPLLELGLTEPEDSRFTLTTMGNSLRFSIEETGLRRSASVDYRNREWRVIMVSWDGASGAIEMRNATLDGSEEELALAKGPTFAPKLGYLRIGPEVRAQFMDILVYDRALEKEDWEQLKRTLPAKFFTD